MTRLRIGLGAAEYELNAQGDDWLHVGGPAVPDVSLPAVPGFAADPGAALVAQPARLRPWAILARPTPVDRGDDPRAVH